MEQLDLQLAVSMLGFVAAFVFGKHLQSGFTQLLARARITQQPGHQDF